MRLSTRATSLPNTQIIVSEEALSRTSTRHNKPTPGLNWMGEISVLQRDSLPTPLCVTAVSTTGKAQRESVRPSENMLKYIVTYSDKRLTLPAPKRMSLTGILHVISRHQRTKLQELTSEEAKYLSPTGREQTDYQRPDHPS